MDNILLLALSTTLTLTALAQPEEYSKFPPIEDSKVFIFDNRHIHKSPDEQVLVKVDPGTGIKPVYVRPRPQNALEKKIEPDREYSEDEKNYQYQVREVIEQDTKLKGDEPVYLQFYDPQKLNKKEDSKNIDVDINISEEKRKRYHQGILTYIPRIPKIFGNYDHNPKNVLVNVNIHKDDLDKYTKQDGAKKININVKLRRVDEPDKEIEAQEQGDSVINRLYRVSKKYTGL